MSDHQIANQFSRPRSSKRAAIAACTLALGTLHLSAVAADNPGAHEHGHARLQIALEGSQVDVMFTSPAHNLAGFEHQARTEEEKARLNDIRSWLETTPLLNTTDGHCTVAEASILLGGSPESHDDYDHHEEHGDDHHSDHHDEHGHHGDETTHRDYEVTQQLTCGGPASGKTFTSALMKEFPELRELDIEWVSETGQGSLEMTSPDMTFTLGE